MAQKKQGAVKVSSSKIKIETSNTNISTNEQEANAEKKSSDFKIETYSYDIFISYSHDAGFYMAQTLYNFFTKNGYSVFMDKDLDSGKFEPKICYAARTCKNFISVLFPNDMEKCKNSNSWLSKELAWALEGKSAEIIPLKCDEFNWPKDQKELSKLSEAFQKAIGHNDRVITKNSNFDSNLERLCSFLKNVNPSNKMLNTLEFFNENIPLEERSKQPDETTKESESQAKVTKVKEIQAAFHAGAKWLVPGPELDILIHTLENGIRWKVLINKPEIAEQIGSKMRNENALYFSFEVVRNHWKKLESKYATLEVRECSVPLVHIYHNIEYNENYNEKNGASTTSDNSEKQKNSGLQAEKSHVKYYAYSNSRTDNIFEHEINSYSKYHKLYKDEFMYLWELSKTESDKQ